MFAYFSDWLIGLISPQHPQIPAKFTRIKHSTGWLFSLLEADRQWTADRSDAGTNLSPILGSLKCERSFHSLTRKRNIPIKRVKKGNLQHGLYQHSMNCWRAGAPGSIPGVPATSRLLGDLHAILIGSYILAQTEWDDKALNFSIAGTDKHPSSFLKTRGHIIKVVGVWFLVQQYTASWALGCEKMEGFRVPSSFKRAIRMVVITFRIHKIVAQWLGAWDGPRFTLDWLRSHSARRMRRG